MFRLLVTMGGAVMAASALAPWLAGPFGQTAIPADMFRAMYDLFGLDMPREALLFFSMFAVGAAIAVLAVIGAAPQLLVLLAGLYPAGLFAAAWWRGADEIAALGLPVPEGATAGEIWDQLSPIVGNGLWMFLGGMVALVLAGLAGGRR